MMAATTDMAHPSSNSLAVVNLEQSANLLMLSPTSVSNTSSANMGTKPFSLSAVSPSTGHQLPHKRRRIARSRNVVLNAWMSSKIAANAVKEKVSKAEIAANASRAEVAKAEIEACTAKMELAKAKMELLKLQERKLLLELQKLNAPTN